MVSIEAVVIVKQQVEVLAADVPLFVDEQDLMDVKNAQIVQAVPDEVV